jgi:hypothetical protein
MGKKLLPNFCKVPSSFIPNLGKTWAIQRASKQIGEKPSFIYMMTIPTSPGATW